MSEMRVDCPICGLVPVPSEYEGRAIRCPICMARLIARRAAVPEQPRSRVVPVLLTLLIGGLVMGLIVFGALLRLDQDARLAMILMLMDVALVGFALFLVGLFVFVFVKFIKWCWHA